jgi:hypothetical protein
VIGARLATLHELETVYGLEDLWLLFEIDAVRQHNEYQARKHANNHR